VTLREEVTALLQALIRLDTVNPPGNETRAAELLRGYLEGNGVESTLLAKVPERANLVARLPGGDGPSLALICHTDTVLADPAEWRRDPWSGELVEGEVWGRGALDMKGHVAAAAVAFASLAREGFRPAGDLIFAATADEEVGDGFGLEWLVAERPDTVRCDYSINEGGGERVLFGDQVFYLCSTAEKMSAPFRLRVYGRSGHASMPAIADNALVKAATLVSALGGFQPPREIIPEVAGFLRAVLGDAPPAGEALERARELHPLAAELVEPLLSTTVAPTMAHASEKRNVIPSVCELTVDCRILPGRSTEEVEPLIRAVLGDGDYDLEWIERWGGTRSELESPLWDAVTAFVSDLEAGARVAPICSSGFTDSHWLRAAFGTVAYGFFPARAMPAELAARLIHSADERVPVDDLELGVEFLRAVSRSLLAA
jgi:acetylornithine deacetylase/succinyl-diaminopimelate desuccinylase-like protein